MEVEQTYGDQVRFVGVPIPADVDAMKQFVSEKGLDELVHIPDSDSMLRARFGVTSNRHFVFVNDDGTTVITGSGSLDEDVQALIER